MKNGGYRITYLIALLLISISFGFSASIWSTPPSLGYLAIFISSIFAIVMTFSWCSTLWKSKYGKLSLIINSAIGLMSIGFLMKKSGEFEDYQRYINIIANILAAISTLIFGMINYIKINMKILSSFLMTAMMVTLFGCLGSEVSLTSHKDTSGGFEEIVASEEATGSNESSVPKEVIIGKQVWKTENLNVDKFQNGDPIAQAKTDEEWVKAGENGEPAWCYYDNDPANGEKYGKIYNWYAVNDPRGLSPEGWHIPSDVEWLETINHLGGENEAGIKMKNTSGWFENGNGTNQSGFKGFPSGVRGDNGDFTSLGKNGFWWSSTETEKQNKKVIVIFYLDYSFKWVIKEVALKGSGLTVRCVKDE